MAGRAPSVVWEQVVVRPRQPESRHEGFDLLQAFESISWVWLQPRLGRKCARGKAGKSRDSLSAGENCERIRSKVLLGNESRPSSPGSSCSDNKDGHSRPESLVLVRAKAAPK